MNKSQIEYTITTKSRLLAEFSQCPEGMGKLLLIITLPIWGISWLVRIALKHTLTIERKEDEKLG